MAPLVSASANAQSVAGLAAIVAVSTAWPALAPRSYIRWRTPALAALRLALFLLPFNYSTAILEAIVPGPATGRWSWAANTSHLLMGTHTALLLFSALLWRLPLGPHLVVQTAAVGLLAAFGVHPHCQSRLLSSPQARALASAVVGCGSLATAVLVPAAPTPDLALGEPYRQTVAALLFLWAALGWLVPTLLVLPKPGCSAEPQSTRQEQQQQRSATTARVDRWLRGLLPEPPAGAGGTQPAAAALGRQGGALVLALRWFVTLTAFFQLSSVIALLYSAPPPP